MPPPSDAQHRPSPVEQFISKHFALVVMGSMIGVFSLIALVGKRPAPSEEPTMVTKLSSEDRKLIEQVRSEFAARDAGSLGPDYSVFRDLPAMVKLPMVTNFRSYVERTDAGSHVERLHGALVVDGDLKRAFFYVHIDRPLGSAEQVWLTLQDKGGQLLSAQSLPVPPDPKTTTLLYDAHSVPHVRIGADGLPHHLEAPSDWFAILTSGNRPRVEVFLSATSPGTIDVTLFYECVEPQKCSLKYEPIR